MNREESTYSDEFFMQRCLELAQNGLENVAPNPMVGAVVVYQGKPIGEGYHQVYGGPHAEVNAVRVVKENKLLEKSTLYVNLEPCAHSGKTPPCTDLILNNKIPRVVIGTTDSNSLVAGKGIQKLLSAGVEVKTGVLENACYELNRRFFLFHQKKRPYIIIKWAQTQDGFMDIVRDANSEIGVNWISNSLSQTLVHKWRAQEQAILVGKNTALLDNPQLTVRHCAGKNPLRILLDRQLEVPGTARIYDDAAATLVFNEKIEETRLRKEFILFRKSSNQMDEVLEELYARNVISIIVEGGKHILETLLESGLWDEARVIIGDKSFGNGVAAPRILADPFSREYLLNDQLLVYRNTHN